MNSSTIILSIICSVVSVIVITIALRFRTFIKLYRMNGSYIGYSFNDDNPHSERKYVVKYSFWNLLRFSNYLTILQQSPAEKYGNWESRIMISTSNPLIATGNFTYETGKYSKAWGLHNICINLDAKIINIEVVEMHNNGVLKYYIKKK